VSVSDRKNIKEVYKYQNVLRELSLFGEFFSNTMLENLDFSDLIEKYGHKEDIVFFVDPPYPGFSTYYSHNLSNHSHEQLAVILLKVPAPAICTFYDHPLVRKLYPETFWKYEVVAGLKNGQQGGNKEVEELILTKRKCSSGQINRYLSLNNIQATMSFKELP
jgi:site-specific DNA-adenine methylase